MNVPWRLVVSVIQPVDTGMALGSMSESGARSISPQLSPSPVKSMRLSEHSSPSRLSAWSSLEVRPFLSCQPCNESGSLHVLEEPAKWGYLYKRRFGVWIAVLIQARGFSLPFHSHLCSLFCFYFPLLSISEAGLQTVMQSRKSSGLARCGCFITALCAHWYLDAKFKANFQLYVAVNCDSATSSLPNPRNHC